MWWIFLLVSLWLNTGRAGATWGAGNKHFTTIIKKRHQNKNRSRPCAPLNVGSITQLSPLQSNEHWQLDLVIPVEGAGRVEIGMDLDGSGKIDGLDAPYDVKMERSARYPIPGQFELIDIITVSREDTVVRVNKRGQWGHAIPIDDIEIVIRACPSLCFNPKLMKSDRYCREFRYSIPITSEDLPVDDDSSVNHETNLRVHAPQAAYGIPDDFVEDNTTDITVGIVAGASVSAIIFIAAGSTALYEYFLAGNWSEKDDGVWKKIKNIPSAFRRGLELQRLKRADELERRAEERRQKELDSQKVIDTQDEISSRSFVPKSTSSSSSDSENLLTFTRCADTPASSDLNSITNSNSSSTSTRGSRSSKKSLFSTGFFPVMDH